MRQAFESFTDAALKFTPLEFETENVSRLEKSFYRLKFTPLEFETIHKKGILIRIAS